MIQQSHHDGYQLPRWLMILIGSGSAVAVVLMLVFVMVGIGSRPTATPPTASQSVGVVTASSSPSSPAIAVTSPPTNPVASIPPKAIPIRLVIAGVHIDVPLQQLPMTPEQIAQRAYDAPEQPGGYWVQFREAGQTYFDLPGAGMQHAAFIVGHSCSYTKCIDADGRLSPQADWPFTRLPNVTKGMAVSVFTQGGGEVCSRVTDIKQVGRDDASAQDAILNEVYDKEYLVINTCETGDNDKGYLILTEIRSCQG